MSRFCHEGSYCVAKYTGQESDDPKKIRCQEDGDNDDFPSNEEHSVARGRDNDMARFRHEGSYYAVKYAGQDFDDPRKIRCPKEYILLYMRPKGTGRK